MMKKVIIGLFLMSIMTLAILSCGGAGSSNTDPEKLDARQEYAEQAKKDNASIDSLTQLINESERKIQKTSAELESLLTDIEK